MSASKSTAAWTLMEALQDQAILPLYGSQLDFLACRYMMQPLRTRSLP